MGRLRQRDDATSHELEAETSIGRASGVRVRIAQAHVSMQHASLRWTERGSWELRDLQSKNGTYVNGERVVPGTPVKLGLGDEVAFGSRSDAFIVDDASPPRAMLVRVNEPRQIILLHDPCVALPGPEAPSVSLFRDEGGSWSIDSHDRVGRLDDGDLITIGTEHWRCCFPTTPDETELLGHVAGLFVIAELELRLGVTPDEAAIELTLHAHGRDVRLGQKACHSVLLALARCRPGGDLQAALALDAGWVSVSALLDLLHVSEQRLNVDIFRIRQELKAAGVIDAAGIIERDPLQRRLRLGTDKVVLTTLANEPTS